MKGPRRKRKSKGDKNKKLKIKKKLDKVPRVGVECPRAGGQVERPHTAGSGCAQAVDQGYGCRVCLGAGAGATWCYFDQNQPLKYFLRFLDSSGLIEMRSTQ